jgi:hypothetical protein
VALIFRVGKKATVYEEVPVALEFSVYLKAWCYGFVVSLEEIAKGLATGEVIFGQEVASFCVEDLVEVTGRCAACDEKVVSDADFDKVDGRVQEAHSFDVCLELGLLDRLPNGFRDRDAEFFGRWAGWGGRIVAHFGLGSVDGTVSGALGKGEPGAPRHLSIWRIPLNKLGEQTISIPLSE